MTGFIVSNPINSAGEPLHRAARRIRLEVETKMVAHRDLAEDPGALQIVGLLLQLEGLARGVAARPIEAIAARHLDSAPQRQARA